MAYLTNRQSMNLDVQSQPNKNINPDNFVQFRPGKDVWAFGVEPAKVKYRLRLARYPALAESLEGWLQTRSTQAEKPKLLDIPFARVNG